MHSATVRPANNGKMSSDPRGFYPGSNGDTNDTNYTDAIAIAGCVMASLIALVILRLFVNLCIDVVILNDFDSARRSLGALLRFVFPWWHRRTQPEELASPDSDRQQDVELNIPTRMSHPSIEQRKISIGSILQSKVRMLWMFNATLILWSGCLCCLTSFSTFSVTE